jgi:hypothetical protein
VTLVFRGIYRSSLRLLHHPSLLLNSRENDAGKLMAGDLISLGFMNSPDHLSLIENSKPISQITMKDYDAVLFVAATDVHVLR